MAFDTLEYARRLKSAGFSDQQAEVLAEATRDLVAKELVTKSFLQSELEKLSMRLTIRMGTIAAVPVAALAAIIKSSSFDNWSSRCQPTWAAYDPSTTASSPGGWDGG
jgi:hypothetical protein